MSAVPSDTFCIYPWIHLYVNPDGSALPCCVADHHSHMGNVRANTIKEVWNSEQYKELRKNMLSGKRCKECQGCYNNEDKGLLSTRQNVNDRYSQHIHLADLTNEDGSLDEMHLRHFDVRWSNICNFKCRSCSHTYSSSWAKEDGLDNIYIFAGGNSNDLLYDQFEPYFNGIETFYFAGGEPLLTDKHYEILEYLIENNKTDVLLDYNTNLSKLTYKNKNILDLWKNFKNVRVHASIDSYGDRAEYIREGTNWNDIKSNLLTIKESTPHVQLQTGSVISAFNIFTIPEFLNEMKEIFGNNYSPFFYTIINPNYYSADILNDNFKNLLLEKLISYQPFNDGVRNEVDKVIQYVKESNFNEDLKEQFVTKNMYYDKKRNRNFSNTFPELDWIVYG